MDDWVEIEEVPRFHRIPKGLHVLTMGCVGGLLVLSPWCFGSWEMWWFWPMASLLFLGSLVGGVGSLWEILSQNCELRREYPHIQLQGPALVAILGFVPFWIYLGIRSCFPSAEGLPLVRMELERSLLLFYTPLLLALVMLFSFSRRGLARFGGVLFTNMVVIASFALWLVYTGCVESVLWVVSPWNYGGRAKAVFFCPNHLSAFLNLGICWAVALLMTPRIRWWIRCLAGLAGVILFWGNFLTLSRGGLISLLLGLFFGIVLVGLRGHRLWVRFVVPVLALLVLVGSAFLFWTVPNSFKERVMVHPIYQAVERTWGTPECREQLEEAFWYRFDRGTYIQSALRAWRRHPMCGIGPGQHPHRWQEFNATDDGVRPVEGNAQTMVYPRYVNQTQHLYEVHSDWVQLIEETGILGLSLFLLGGLGLVIGLVWSQTRVLRRATEIQSEEKACLTVWQQVTPLAALLSCFVMAIHSLGDFSFQMPSITWTFTALVVIGLFSLND